MHSMQDFMFRREELVAKAALLREQFESAEPFPHIVIDDFLPPEMLEPVLTEFPEPGDATWQEFDNSNEIKLALADTERVGPTTRRLLAEFNGQVFVEFLEELTGIEGLIPDPHFVGGGLHQIRSGGYLKVHTDFNRHRKLRLDRRLNGLLYLNKDWQEDWGGHLQLWSKDMSTCARKVLPVFNRFLLFATTDDANHGHPDPLSCPPDRSRRSIALYYYTNGRPDHEQRPDHTTVFKRPQRTRADAARDALRRWVPPAVVDMASRRRRS